MKSVKLGLALGAAMLAGIGLANAQQVYKTTGTGVSPPLNFIAPNTTAQQGTTVDLLNAIAADAGFSVQYVDPIAPGDLGPALAGGTIDIRMLVCSPSAPQPGVAYSIPYDYHGEGVWVLQADNTDYKSLEDLRGQAVGAIRGTPHDVALAAMPGAFSVVKTYANSSDLARAIISGEVNAGLVPAVIAEYRLHQGEYPELKLASSWQVSMATRSAICVRQADTELLGRINASLTKLLADGTVDRIFANYGITRIQPPSAM